MSKEKERQLDDFSKAFNATVEQYGITGTVDPVIAKEMNYQVLRKIGVQKNGRKAVEKALQVHYGADERYKGATTHFNTTAERLFPEREIAEALRESSQREAILSHLESLMFSPPEQKATKARIVYTQGLSDLLKENNLNDDERREFINALAGEEVAHKRD